MTRQAFVCFHDYVALLACEALHGVGTATASVLLMAQNPDRYTVIDSRALASLRAMGRLPSGGEYAASEDWEPYLDACRGLASETGHSLRDVDRALYAANGRIE